MHNRKMFKKLSLLLVVFMIATFFLPLINADATGAAGVPANSAVQYLYNDYTQNGINNSDAGVGSYALYVLKQAGVDVSSWVYNNVNLEDAVVKAVYADTKNASVSAKCLAQDLAAAEALGQNDLAGQLVQILEARQSSSGFDTGDYSVFSNMPAYDLLGRVGELSVFNAVYAKDYILGTQNTTAGAAYGSWDNSTWPDFMTTAEAVRALTYLTKVDPGINDTTVQQAIYNGCNWLQAQQQSDGSFVVKPYDDPLIDTVEAIATQMALDTDPNAWKNSGHSAVDYLDNDALKADGSFGTSKNDMDATWALCAYNSLGIQCRVWRFYIDPSGATLNAGDTKQLTAVWQNAYGSSDVTQYADWSAAAGGIAGVDNGTHKGLFTALSAGQTAVSAVYGGLTASAVLTVNSPSLGSTATAKTVGLAVVGMNGELLYGPSYVTVTGSDQWGLTALGALDASGIPYHTSSWSYGILVDSIDGQANSGMSGWMYAANGQIPSCGPEKYSLNNNDEIVWYYSSSMGQQPPGWNDLLQKASSPSTPGNLPAPISDAALGDALQNAASTGLVALQAASTQTTLALSNAQLARILSAGRPLAVTVQGVQFVLSADSLQVPALTAPNTAQLQIQAQTLGSADVQSLIGPFAGQFELAGDVCELDVLAVNKDGTQQNINQLPDCKVALAVPAAFRDAAAAGRLAAYWYDDGQKTWQEVGGTYDATSGTITFKAPHFSKYALLETVSPPAGKTFQDIAGYWAQKEIEFMATKGYVAGVGNDQFKPGAPITRAEFTTILARLAGLTADPAGARRFVDVSADAWYRGMVGAAASAGLICGTGENTFASNKLLTREQMAVMIVRLMAKNGLDVAITNADVAKLLAGFGDGATVSPWARSAVALVVRQGLMTGRAAGEFVPLGNTSRAEATVVLYRILQKLPQLGK